MRKINWDAPLSAEDKAWARQAGLLLMEDRIRDNEDRFGSVPITGPGTMPNPGAPVTPAAPDDADDYDDWKVAELKVEAADRKSVV